MNPFEAPLAARGFVMFDGGLASELERRGADLSDELWSARLLLDEPQAIVQVSLDSLRAGADVVSSASYQASREGFARRGLSATQADDLLASSVRLAREACARFLGERGATRSDGVVPLVAASLGPWSATRADGGEYRGDDGRSVDELVAFHRPRLEAVLSARPDLVLFETIPSLHEVEAIAQLARETPGAPFMVSCSAVSATGISHGEPFAEVVQLLDGLENVVAVGLNCAPAAVVDALLRTAGPHRALLAAQPNSGERWDAVHRRWQALPADQATTLAGWALRFVEAGARIIGGCCRTRPADIAAMRQALEGPLAQASLRSSEEGR